LAVVEQDQLLIRVTTALLPESEITTALAGAGAVAPRMEALAPTTQLATQVVPAVGRLCSAVEALALEHQDKATTEVGLVLAAGEARQP
jgi:hypothetical protein